VVEIYPLLGLAIVILLYLLIARRNRLLAYELDIIQRQTRRMLRGLPLEPHIRLKNHKAQILWNSLLALGAKNATYKQREQTLEDVVDVGSSIAQAIHEPASVARELAHLLLQEASPYAQAVAIFSCEDQDAGPSFKLDYIEGLPGSRLEQPLLMLVEDIADPRRGLQWGYHIPDKESFYNLDLFDIGLFLAVPIMDFQAIELLAKLPSSRERRGLSRGKEAGSKKPQAYPLGYIEDFFDFADADPGQRSTFAAEDNFASSSIVGAIWIGFKTGASALSTQQRSFITAMARHAAASLCAARSIHEQAKHGRQERDYLLGLSHDLRSPGSSALYAVRELLQDQDDPLNKEQMRKVSVIEHALEEQLSVISDVLDLTRESRGVLTADLRDCSIGDMLHPLFERFSFLAQQKGLSFSCPALASMKPVIACVDSQHLVRIVGNLLSNAVKYTDTGSIAVSCYTEDGAVYVAVADTGIGIPRDEQGDLFAEFARKSNALNRQGTGLGLAVSKLLAQNSGGDLFYEPNSQSGSVFTLRLPLSAVDGSSSCDPLQPNSSIKPVLIIEDDPPVARTYRRYLSGYFSTIEIAHDLKTAHRILESLQPALVIADYCLKCGETSLEIIRDLVNRDPGPKVVVITGSSAQPALVELAQNEKLVLMEKPVSRESLLHVLDLLGCRENQTR